LWWCSGWSWDVAPVVSLQNVPDDKVDVPTLIGGLSPRAIRAAVLEEERPTFERQYREVMAVAAETLDLTGVEELLRAWQRIAELTERDGRENRRRVLAKAVLAWRNRDIPEQDVVRRSREFDELLRQRLTEEQLRQLDASRERMRRQVAADESVTDAQGRLAGGSEPYVLVPLDELNFDYSDESKPAG
jgi:hypothetical protein